MTECSRQLKNIALNNEKHETYLPQFGKLAEAAEFYLEEAFHYVNKCLEENFAGLIFSKLLGEVEPTERDKEISNNWKSPESVIEFFQQDHNVLTDETLQKLSDAWQQALMAAEVGEYSFDKSVEIDSIKLLGHINNFAFFIETLINRHLLFMNLEGQLDNFTYNNLYRAKVLTRMIFVFKEELSSNKVSLNEVSNLFSLRNKTVHYTPENAISLIVKLDALLRIWNQSSKLIQVLHRREKFNEEKFSDLINKNIKQISDRWFKKTR